MESHKISIKVKKIGVNRLCLYIPRENRAKIGFKFKDIIKLEIKKGGKITEVISKYNCLISMKKEVVKKLNLKEGDIVEINLKGIRSNSRPNEQINFGKLDLLSFLPEKTTNGSLIVADKFYKGKVEYLRLCAFHEKGSTFNIEIRRFVDLSLFGKLLGQIQAEGTKTHIHNIEFCNKSLNELKDFLNYLDYLGITRERIFVKIDYHPEIKNIVEEIKKFKNFVGLDVDYIAPNDKGGIGFGFKIIVRNTIFSQLIMNALIELRLIMEADDKRFDMLRDGYLAKLLSGDGNFEITSKKRKTIQSRLKITDGNLEYLKHYKKILEKYGFNPKINEKYNLVRSLCNLNSAKNLLKIGAFENNPNRERVLFFIDSLNKRVSK